MVGLGLAAAFLWRKGETGGEGGHYFLAGNTLAWPVIWNSVGEPLRARCGSGLSDYRAMSVVVLVVFGALCLIFL